MSEQKNLTDFISMPLSATSLNQSNSFVDGDWVESEWITNCGIRLVQTGNIGVGIFLNKGDHARFIAPNSFTKLGCKWVNPGDILICRLAEPIGRSCEVPNEIGNCITSVDCTIFRPDPEKINKRFALQLLNSESHLKKLSDVAGGSTRQRISRKALGAILISIPPIKQQAVITAILDTMDEAIRRTEALIAKLRQVKAGMLHDLLTRGLDENGELRDPIRHPEQFKDSPLGRIPKAWEIKTIEQLTVHIIDGDRGSNYPDEENLFDWGFCVFLNNKNIKDGQFDFSSVQFITKKRDNLLRKGKLSVGDIVITTRGTVGNIAFFKNAIPFQHVRINSGMVIIRNYQEIFDPSFFVYIWQFLFPSEYRRLSSGSAQPQFPIRDMIDHRLIMPSKPEQERIVALLLKFQEPIDWHQNELSKLKKIKFGLMQDLLTGRVRVPEAMVQKYQTEAAAE